MGFAVTLVLLIFWLVLAYRQFQRGDLLLAAVFLAVGVILSIWRFRRLVQAGAAGQPPSQR
jgi:uncharacterized membrane protein YqjE